MSDSGKGPIGGTFEDVGEAIVKPVVDEIGKAIEAGVQAVTPQKTLDPATQQQKQISDQKNLVEARRKVEWWKALEAERNRVRQQNQQKLQAQGQQIQAKQQEKIKQFEIVKKKDNIALKEAQFKTEKRGGVGG